jgi:DNA repair protein RecO (recombination protein O)
MIQSATGMILRRRPLTETSLILHWLTPDFGRIATVAKGAQRPKSPFLGKLDVFYVADFSFSRNRRSDLHVLREVSLRELNPALREDLTLLRQATYATALVERATETGTPLPEIYHLTLDFLKQLREHPARPQTVFAFELKLLHELGLEPKRENTRLSAGVQRISQILAQGGWPEIARLRLAAAQIAELRGFLDDFLVFHLGRLPNNRTAALASGV